MNTHRQRFPKRHYWRVVDDILRTADYFNPGDLTYEDELRKSGPQQRRQLERFFDLDHIAECALSLRDAIGALR